MSSLLTTQNQNCYREQIQKEMLTRLAWKSRYAKLYPSSHPPISIEGETQPPHPTTDPPPAVPGTPARQSEPSPPVVSFDGESRPNVTPPMRPVSPHTKHALYQDSSNHGRGRSQYLQRRGQMRPEEKFGFPLLSSWEYGWRLGDYTLDYKTPSRAKSSVVKNTFYARNGVFSSQSATDSLG